MNQHAHNNVKKQKYDYATFSYKKCLEICIFNIIYKKNKCFSVIEKWEVHSLLCKSFGAFNEKIQFMFIGPLLLLWKFSAVSGV